MSELDTDPAHYNRFTLFWMAAKEWQKAADLLDAWRQRLAKLEKENDRR